MASRSMNRKTHTQCPGRCNVVFFPRLLPSLSNFPNSRITGSVRSSTSRCCRRGCRSRVCDGSSRDDAPFSPLWKLTQQPVMNTSCAACVCASPKCHLVAASLAHRRHLQKCQQLSHARVGRYLGATSAGLLSLGVSA